MTPALAKTVFQFVVSTLPNLLSRFEEPMDALDALASSYREHREHEIKDRDDEVAKNRAAVDAKLEERKKTEALKKKNSADQGSKKS